MVFLAEAGLRQEGATLKGGAADFVSALAKLMDALAKLPDPSVGWPGSDPLVTSVGGTYLCTDPYTGTTVDNTDPPTTCQNQSQREIGWIASVGGYSHVFSRPSFQDTLPPGSTPIPASQRGVPDVGYQASSRTGVLVYISARVPMVRRTSRAVLGRVIATHVPSPSFSRRYAPCAPSLADGASRGTRRGPPPRPPGLRRRRSASGPASPADLP